MIKSIYLLRSNGEILYSKNFIEQEYEENLLIGFFNSVVNFSREALKSVVDFIDLGRESKAILELKPEEEIFGAIICSAKDNNSLVKKILKDILQGFIDEFSPNYNLESRKNKDKVDEIFKRTMKGKGRYSILIRFIISWVLLIPLGGLLVFVNIWASEVFIFTGEISSFGLERLITQTIPQIIIVLFLESVVLFGIPNFISGYVILHIKYSFINTLIYLILILLAITLSVRPILIYPILSFLPFVVISSLGGAYLGNEYGKTKRLS
ncbi:MAG: hypothetical protein EU541_04725 [Promethearchaeota archaeon]|nr:MAG: hypothetical protein EU541_04725 [Candidatus Lokiarchaeota archaeon]